MKKLFLVVFVLILFVLGALGAVEQKFSSLPIGANLDGYISAIRIWYGPLGSTINNSFPYNRQQDGSLEDFAIAKLREMAGRFVPKAGQETALYGWGISAFTDGIGGLLPYYGESKPAEIAGAPPAGEYNGFYQILRNGKWEVPEEVFGKVKFQFGVSVGFYIPDTRHLEVNLYNGTRVVRFSTLERISEEGNSCDLPATIGGLNVGIVSIPEEITLAKPSWWERAEITLLTEDGKSVTFLVNRTAQDGTAIRWSSPPPSFFVPPTPTIASLKRVGDLTEVAVENAGNVVLEFSQDLTSWQTADTTHIALTSDRGGRVFRHKTVAASGYYRLRLKDGAQ